MRYCKQRDQYSCGALALLNIDKFFGRRVTYKDLPKYRKLVNCHRVTGTQTPNISKVIGRASRRSWASAKWFLREGNCIMLLWDEGDVAHYFIMGMYYEEFYVVNRFKPDVGVSAAYIASPQQAALYVRKSFRTWYVNKETGLL